jgi:hypothetical protein
MFATLMLPWWLFALIVIALATGAFWLGLELGIDVVRRNIDAEYAAVQARLECKKKEQGTC